MKFAQNLVHDFIQETPDATFTLTTKLFQNIGRRFGLDLAWQHRLGGVWRRFDASPHFG
jgi:hypothetical protein